jgi:lipoic acid synthetase
LVRERAPETAIEILIPDFMGNRESWQTVFESRPDILNHNTETVPRLVKEVRSVAKWERTLELLGAAKAAGLVTKSGMMLGLGEHDDEIESTLCDLHRAGVSIITLGQYLQPGPAHLPVKEFIPPQKFGHWREWGLKLGFEVVESGPLVRSSYHADEQSARLAPSRG